MASLLRMGRGRWGGVLPLALLGMLALQLLAHGALLMAQRQRTSSRADLRLVAARVAARGAVLEIPRVVRGDALDGVRSSGALEGASADFGQAKARWRLQRLSREAWLGRGWGHPAGAGWEVEEARFLWRMAPLARVAAFPSAAMVGDSRLLDVEGTVSGSATREPCGAHTEALDSIHPWGISALSALGPEDVAAPPLGVFTWAELLDAVEVGLDGEGTPGPVDTAGLCQTEWPWNWGDVLDPAGLCADHRPWRKGEGNVRVVGGAGQGTLLAAGDVELVGVTFSGLILAQGRVRLSDGSRVTGLLRAGGGLHVDGTSGVVGSPCKALLALEAAPAPLRRLRVLADPGWLPLP